MSAAQTLETVPMLVGGRWEVSRSEPLRRGVQPLDRPSDRPGAARHGGGCRSGRRGRRERLAGLGRDAGRRAGAGAVPVSRAAGRHADELARLVTREHGKTLAEARASVQRGIEMVEFACGIPSLLMGQTLPNIARRRRLRDGPPPGRRLRRDHAVQLPGDGAALDVPGGDRLRQHVRPQALGEGAALGRPARRAADGVGPAGGGLQHRPRRQGVRRRPARHTRWCAAISFVGSTAVARHVYETGTRNGKRVQAAGGAKNHLIIMPDADLDQAALARAGARPSAAPGERCMAGSVAVPVGEHRRSAWSSGSATCAGRMKVGPTDGGADVDMGPVITREHCDRVAGYLDIGRHEGAEVVARRPRQPPSGDGFLIGPSVLDRVEPGMRVAREEIFGPVLSVVRVGDLDEALAVGRDCPYGNGASIFTRSGWAARQFKHHFNAGMIGINVGVPAPMAWFPFTGWNQSFFGDLHIQGIEGDAVLHAAEDDDDPLVRVARATRTTTRSGSPE